MAVAKSRENPCGPHFLLLVLLTIVIDCCECSVSHKLHVGVLFTTKIDHSLFNWTSNGNSDQFTFRSSLTGYPDLPSFLRYMYSEERRVGYLYGAPSEKFSNQEMEIEIIALNRQTFETRVQKMNLSIEKRRKNVVNNVLQMKIDNQDWVNFLMDPGRIEDLKNIFRNDLWPESEKDLNVVFLDAAVNLGGRLPASPQLKEGVVLQLGSRMEFSARLKDLHEEVKPLYKMASCKFKRTSVQAIFDASGFKLDWCAFKLIELAQANATQSEAKKLKGEMLPKGDQPWQGLKFEDIPERNYIDELAFTIAIPGMIFAVLVAVLSGILCFQHESIRDDYSEFFFENIFHICEDLRTPRNVPTVVHLSDPASSSQLRATTTTTLKSLRDAPGTLPDDVSINSRSPNCSRSEELTPHLSSSSTYLRPKPPPYKHTGQSPFASYSLGQSENMGSGNENIM